MSAEVLRAAAALMRERAGAATGSPEFSWITSPTEGDWHAVMDEEHGDDVAASASATNVEHIASWHPAVALAVADWLDDIATRHERDPDPIELMLHWDEECPTGECADGDGHESIVCRGCYPSWEGMDGHSLWPCAEVRAALTVARAYLGSDQ